MPTAKKSTRKAPVKVRDMKAKKNPKGGLGYSKIRIKYADKLNVLVVQLNSHVPPPR